MPTETARATRVVVSIGDQMISYALVVTSAPPNYDAWRTLTLWDSGENDGKDRRRYVLVNAEHLQWQMDRFRSGLYAAEVTDEMSQTDVTDKLWITLTDKLCPGS